MFSEKPLTGFGSGTFQFQYLSYQVESEKTRISVTSPYNIKPGRGGTAHSEYLLALSESGIFSLLFFSGMILFTIRAGMQNYYNLKDERLKYISGFVLLGFITYCVHGFFNNFLDTDKTAFLFFGAMSVIVTIRIGDEDFFNTEARRNGGARSFFTT
jgi:O-antigen ligase